MVELSTPVKSWIFSETIAIEGLQVQFLSVSFVFFLHCIMLMVKVDITRYLQQQFDFQKIYCSGSFKIQ